MIEHEATRTLVKSPPEVWAQCSEPESLERHLSGSFGEIRITRLEPETAVAWEGDEVRGTVRIEPSAWGTRVTLTARLEGQRVPEPEPLRIPPPAAAAPQSSGRAALMSGLWARLRRRRPEVVGEEESPEPLPEEVVQPRCEALDILNGALDSLGAAHHRPFSRS